MSIDIVILYYYTIAFCVTHIRVHGQRSCYLGGLCAEVCADCRKYYKNQGKTKKTARGGVSGVSDGNDEQLI